MYTYILFIHSDRENAYIRFYKQIMTFIYVFATIAARVSTAWQSRDIKMHL